MGSEEGAAAVADTEAASRQQNRTRLDKEDAEKFQRDQNRLAQENVQQIQQESKEEAKEERLRVF